MFLVDTSVWIKVFRRFSPLDLESVVAFDEVVTCPVIIQEVLQGFRDDRAHRLAREAMMALPTVETPTSLEVYLSAADLYRAAARAGLTIRSAIDCLIATCALRNGLTILHDDRDFTHLAKVSPLAVKELR